MASKKRSKKKATPRAKCARGTTQVITVGVLPGQVYATVRYCRTARGKLLVKNKRFTKVAAATEQREPARRPVDYVPAADPSRMYGRWR